MKTKQLLTLLASAAFVAGSAHAAAIAKFDIQGANNTPTRLQAGYTAFDPSNNGPTGVTSNGVTLIINGTGWNESRDRGLISTSPADFTPLQAGLIELGADFLFARNTETPTFTLTGLNPSTDYSLRIWTYDTLGDSTSNWYQGSVAPGNLLSTYTYDSRGTPVGSLGPDDMGFDAVVTTDVGGSVVILTTATGLMFLNGVEISPVPEASAFALIGFAGLAFFARRRR